MKKIVIKCETGRCGTSSIHFYELPDEYPTIYLDELANQLAYANAESYGMYAPNDIEDLGENDISEDICGWVEAYDPKLHNMLVPGGGEPVFECL